MLQTARAVSLRNQFAGVGDAPLPVETGVFLAGAERFPDCNGGIRHGTANRQRGSVGARLERRPDMQLAAAKNVEFSCCRGADFGRARTRLNDSRNVRMR